MTTFLAIARLSKLEFTQFSIHARGKLERIDGNGIQVTSVVLQPKLMVHNERDMDRGARMIRKAERNCLISNSIKTEVKVEPILENPNPTGVWASLVGGINQSGHDFG
jgi:organic hydroperoxide reductase OsmC/OhrA